MHLIFVEAQGGSPEYSLRNAVLEEQNKTNSSSSKTNIAYSHFLNNFPM